MFKNYSSQTKIFFTALVGLLALTLPACAADYPTPQGFVTDTADVLSAEGKSSLESRITAFKQQTSNEIAVVIISSLAGEPIEDYGVQLFERWGIGQKEKDNGILILVARDDRAVRIEVGYGLEPVINDAKAGRIIREVIVPALQQEKYAQGLTAAVDVITAEITGSSGGLPPAAEENSASSWLNPDVVLFGTIVFVYLGSYLARSKRWWPGGVIGATGGGILGGFLGAWLAWAIGLGILGLVLDFLLSKNYKQRSARGKPTDWWHSGGGFFGGSGFGGFGGFGGGSSGGGGASGRW